MSWKSRPLYQYCSTPSSPKKNTNPDNYINQHILDGGQIPQQCQHQKKILFLKQKIKDLQESEQYLMRKNDQIIRGMQKMAEKQRKQEEQIQIWKKKYEQLRAQNDRKAIKLASNATFSSFKEHKNNTQRQREKLRQRQNSNRQIRQSIENKTKRQHKCVEQMLTKQQREYVKQLQQSKRQRSGSLKNINYVSQNRKYSTVLPDGLVIHIVDDRTRFSNNRY